MQGKRIKLGQQDTGQIAITTHPVIGLHIDKILAPVGIVKERRVKTGRVDIDRVAPGTGDIRCGGDIVMCITKWCFGKGFDIGIDEIEKTVRCV